MASGFEGQAKSTHFLLDTLLSPIILTSQWFPALPQGARAQPWRLHGNLAVEAGEREYFVVLVELRSCAELQGRAPNLSL